MRKTYPPLFLTALAAGLVFSCTGFFSTSLAPWAARDSVSLIPPVDAGNVQGLVAGAENSPDMSLELLKKIRDAANGAGGEEAAALQTAALQAAVNASGLGAALLNSMNDIAGIIDNPESARDFTGVLNDMPNLEQAGAVLMETLPEPGTPEFDMLVEKAGPDDLAAAAVALLASEAKGKGENFINDFDPSAADAGSARLAVALAEAAAKKYEASDSGGLFKDVLGGLNLIPKGA
jgi:hypothetical protein